jgi:nitroreductase
MNEGNYCHRHRSGEPPTGPYANDTMKLLLERSSCRSFEDRPIPDDVLNEILGAGIHAATGGNLQPYSIIKIADRQANKRLADLCEQEFIGTAPVNLLFCLDYRRLRRWAEAELCPFSAESSFRHFWIGFQDVVIAAQNICTATDALGLGSV